MNSENFFTSDFQSHFAILRKKIPISWSESYHKRKITLKRSLRYPDSAPNSRKIMKFYSGWISGYCTCRGNKLLSWFWEKLKIKNIKILGIHPNLASSHFWQKFFVSNDKVLRQHVTIFATQSITILDRARNQKKRKNLTVKVETGKPCLLLMKNSSTETRENHKNS